MHTYTNENVFICFQTINWIPQQCLLIYNLPNNNNNTPTPNNQSSKSSRQIFKSYTLMQNLPNTKVSMSHPQTHRTMDICPHLLGPQCHPQHSTDLPRCRALLLSQQLSTPKLWATLSKSLVD